MLFVSALELGYHREELAAWLHGAAHVPAALWPDVRFALGGRCHAYWSSWRPSGILARRTRWSDVRPLAFVDRSTRRASASGGWRVRRTASIIYVAVTLSGVPIERAVGWLLIPLGQASLYAYAVHLFLIVLAYNVPPYVGSDQPGWELHNTIGQLCWCWWSGRW